MTPRRPLLLDLDRSLAVLLTFAANRLNSTGSAAYRAKLGLGITEVRLLIMLAVEPDIVAARICEVMGIDTGAASRTLREMEGRGLVRQRRDPHNRAYRRWTLTPAGDALHDQAVTIALERDRILTAAMTTEERDLMIDLLKRILARTPDLAALVQASGEPAVMRPDKGPKSLHSRR